MPDANSDHHVDTPILDSESTHLLHSIAEQGGYAYVRMASRAAAGDLGAGEAAREMAWEQLHPARRCLGGGELPGVLPRKSLSCKMVVKRSGLSLEGFLSEYLFPGCPVIITDGMDHWPARSNWNDMDFLTKVAGDRTVPVEGGKTYLYPEWKQELITFSQFLERIQANCSTSAVPTYLAQHPLFFSPL